MAERDVGNKRLITREVERAAEIEVDVCATGVEVFQPSKNHTWFAASTGGTNATEAQLRATKTTRHQVDGRWQQVGLVRVDFAQEGNGQVVVLRIAPGGGQIPGLEPFGNLRQAIPWGIGQFQGEKMLHDASTTLLEFTRSHAWQGIGVVEAERMCATESMTLLDSWLRRQLKAETAAWLRDTCAAVVSGGGTRALFIAFSTAGRRAGREDMRLSAADLAAAQEVRRGWDPSRWSIDQAVRTRLVLALPSSDAKAWLTTLDQLFAAAGLEELVALYQALPLLPHPELLPPRIAEGVRSNMKPVFNAVALDNPITADRLEQDAWNQTVLKALFVASPVARMVGADRRANPVLAQMLIDYARERIAAKRPVPVDLWDAARPGCNDAQRVELGRLQHSAAAATA